MSDTPMPLVPRITKSTAIAAITARFQTTEALLQRFEVAKTQANLWDGERDGLREAVKKLEGGQYGHTILSWSTSAAVMYPNAAGKHQLENCMQSTVPIPKKFDVNDQIMVFQIDGTPTPEQFLDAILSHMQKGKDHALEFIQARFLGAGELVSNTDLYEKKGADKSQITVLPEV
jgi:hypothetical protein